jgi:malate dehydrogenase (oxaloacetate-decarboxylating)
VPEIYPYEAKEAGAYIVATGRGDFPNQVNNSMCFPAILKGTLLVSARKITDEMAICAAHSIADYAERQGINTEHIMPTMMDTDMFPTVAADVAMCAIQQGVARKQRTWQEVYDIATHDITETRRIVEDMQQQGIISTFPVEEIKSLMQAVCEEVR